MTGLVSFTQLRSAMVLVAIGAGLSGCHDNLIEPSRAKVPVFLTVAIQCSARPADRSVSCGAPSSATARTPAASRDSARRLLARVSSLPRGVGGSRVRQAVIGGQGEYLLLDLKNPTYSAGTGIFAVTATLTNLLLQPLGTIDGVAGADSTFPKVFFVAGTGVPLVANATGSGTFTGSGQPYFLFPEVLVSGAASVAQPWQFNLGASPTAFDFTVLVNARLPDESASGFFVGPRAFAQTASGAQSMCAVRIPDAAYCWGDNSTGQLGNGRIDRLDLTSLPRNDPANQDFATLSAGEGHACGVNAAGQLHCWGDNTAGQLGRGFAGSFFAADSVALGHRYQRALAGGRTTCALRTDQLLECWGENSSGQLGDGTFTDRTTPVVVSLPASVLHAAVGERHACAVLTTKALYCWGANEQGQLGLGFISPAIATPTQVGSGVVAVVAGNAHTCVLLFASSLANCWGRNGEGQVGAGTSNLIESSIVAVAQSTPYQLLAAGGNTTCAIRQSDGAAECWGEGNRGQIGNGLYADANRPRPVSGARAYSEVSVGLRHVCAKSSPATLYCWGDNNALQLAGAGVLGSSGVPVVTPTSISAVAAGGDFTCLKQNLSAATFCSGSNYAGVVDPFAARPQLTPAGMAGAYRFVQVALGDRFGCGVTGAGVLACWGANDEGQLGVGASDVRAVPVTVPPASAGFTWRRVATGRAHACAIDSNDNLYCWGANARAQLAQDGVSRFEDTPRFAESQVVSVMAGEEHSCVVRFPGNPTLSCWGRGTEGQVGYGGLIDQENPVNVTMPPGYVLGASVAAGGRFTCARLTRVANSLPAIYCWGANDALQLGNIGPTIQLTPSLAIGGAILDSLMAGRRHACATSGGAAYCWGDNGRFQQAVDASTGPQSAHALRASVSTGRSAASGPMSDRSCISSFQFETTCWGGRQSRGERGSPGGALIITPTSPVVP